MLKNGRNLQSNRTDLDFDACSCHNSKNARRKVKKTFKRREERHWREEDNSRGWNEARRGELWELKHSGEFSLWVCLDPTGYASFWESYDGKWMLIEDEDLEAISQGKFTGVVLDLN